MNIVEIVLIAIGLAMDAFAVSICKGLALGRLKFRHYIIIGAWFGGFQALMPLIGFFLGNTFSNYIQKYDHWVAFGLLCFIGINMIREAFGEDEACHAGLGFFSMLVLAVATSIDALAVGVTFAFYKVDVLISVMIIGIITFIISTVGVKIGNIFGTRYQKRAEITGGAILVLLGIKLLAEGLI